MAFGNLYEQDSIFSQIPVAVVKNEENEAFETMLEELSKDSDDGLLDVSYMIEKDAKTAIDKEKVKAIIYMDEELKLVVSDNSYESTVVETVMNEYKKQEKVLTDIAINHPENLETAINNLMSEKTFYVTKTTSDGNQDMLTNYFYAIFAMSCLFGSFGAVEKISKMQANVSALGMRRCLTPNSKMTQIVAEFLSMLIVQVVVEVFALGYFSMIGVDFGNKYPQIIGILFFGCCIGIAFGVIIGSIPNLSEGSKSGICTLVSMVLSVMADLCASGVKDAIEHTMPIINRINPAALIVDSFYALNVYDTYERYIRNMVTLGGMSVLLLVVSFIILRRNKYASV